MGRKHTHTVESPYGSDICCKLKCIFLFANYDILTFLCSINFYCIKVDGNVTIINYFFNDVLHTMILFLFLAGVPAWRLIM